MAVSNVLLTGGNGFIAVHIISLLLQHGHTVTTTVRSESKVTHLRNTFSTAVGTGQLKFAIVEDIASQGAFDRVVKDNSFDAIMHTCSPLIFGDHDVEKETLQPAIKGTGEILRSAKEHGPTIKRIIITSSFAAYVNFSNAHNHVYTEKDWNPITYEFALENPQLAYYASKTLAEKGAWEFIEHEKPGFDLVTIAPTRTYGPVLHEVTSLNNLNDSSVEFYKVFSGQDKELNRSRVWLWVDVRDVAIAHVAALEKPEAGGHRFLLAEGTFNLGQVAEYIWTHYPDRAKAKGIPRSTPTSGYPPEGVYTADTSAAKTILGIEYIKFDDMLKDQLAQLVILEKELEGTRQTIPRFVQMENYVESH
ncbi:NADPH-dependent methylglyoxal reductase GRE2 protein, putative [Rhizoctonia solani AG-3 Rhs1AP]|uniref:NADPH-dependent methylglyoxal reductase GRE2 protein, putative n=1 Tax=Rhizoctonia solani AG-3 Rhs1AP TaxID=1086054 RepID=X8JFH2_9AGAM|nr:NADPH-dependent methylglyoxal reductase GRE2 protein, putative [Rhizoctonia solani AG-3 Rhs1AP]